LLKLVIEVDGGQHSEEADAARTTAIEAEGYKVLRFWNNEVLGNPDGCARTLTDVLAASSPRPTPARQQAAKPSHPSPIKGEGPGSTYLAG